MKKLRIVFFGTADFAVASLQAIHQGAHELIGVVTAPDKPAGRGKKLRSSPIKKYALGLDIPVLQPEKLKNPDFIDHLKALKADLFVVVAFRMLPEVVWNMPPKGTVNVHASLLPQYRGAAPINHVLLNGEKETGVSVFFLQHEIDTGDVLVQDSLSILPDENAGTLHDRLMEKGASALTKALDLIAKGNYTAIPQRLPEGTSLLKAPKIFKEDCLLDFSKDALRLKQQILALSPYPGAFTWIEDPQKGRLQLKILEAGLIESEESTIPGKIFTDGSKIMNIECGRAVLHIEMVQLQGKKPMRITDFLRGFRNLEQCHIVS